MFFMKKKYNGFVRMLVLFSFFVSFYLLNGCDYSLKTEISGNDIHVALHGPDQKKIGFARGRQFPNYIELDLLFIFQEKNRKKGYGSKILQEFLSQAAAYGKPVFATASPLGHNFKSSLPEAVNGLIQFYQNHGALVLYKDYESASMAFLHRPARA